MKKFFTLIAVAAMAFAAQANVLVVADGEYQSSGNPVYGLWFDTPGITQQIYPADMLAEMAGGEISEITFTTIGAAYEAMGYSYEEVYEADYRYYINFNGADVTLALMETNELGFTEVVAYVGATVVGTATPVEGASELTFVLDEPFAYNGGNLLIEVTYDGTGDYGTTYFWGMGMVDENDNLLYYPSYYAYENYSGTLNGNLSGFLPMATFTYEPGTEPGPGPEPTEMTAAPIFNGYTTDGIHAYFVEIVPTEPSTIYYRVQYPDGTWTEWAEYEEILSFTGDGMYRVEAYAVAPGKLESYPIAYEFVVSPLTGLTEMTGNKTVASQRYFNAAGQEMSEANGLTIVVTTYTDGTTSTAKVIK